MTELHKLPPLSKHIRVLTAEESARLDAADRFLPKSLKECVTCHGRKKFRWWEDYGASDKIVDYECPCSEQFVLFKYLLNAGVQLAQQRYALGDVTHVDPKATQAMIEYVLDYEFFMGQGRGFIFQGDRGTGKTLLAVIMLKMLLDKGVEGHYILFDTLLDRYSDGWKEKKDQVWFDQRIRSIPLLVVDDIGKEASFRTGFSSVAVDSLFRSRVQAGKPTIITTNLSTDKLQSTYSTALETIAGQAMSFQFKGKSYRESEHEKERIDIETKLRLTRPVTIQ